MNDKPQMKLSETVVLIDTNFLNFVITSLKGYFEKALNRSLQDIDISVLTTYMVLDAGLVEGSGDKQFLLVHDKESSHLQHCHPSDLKKELDGIAFQNSYGEFFFASIPSENLVSRGELFLDLLTIVSDSADVKNLIVVSFNEEYGDQVTEILNGVKEKKVFQFRMFESEIPLNYQWQMLGFPIMQALGIKADELV